MHGSAAAVTKRTRGVAIHHESLIHRIVEPQSNHIVLENVCPITLIPSNIIKRNIEMTAYFTRTA